MRRGTARVWLAAACLAAAPAARAQPAEKAAGRGAPAPPHRIERAASEIRIDGVLDEPAWESALTLPLLYEWFPGDNVPPPVETEALLAYDDDNLYVAFRAFDPEPARVRAHLMDRDLIDTFVQDDHVIVMIDTFNDERRALQFRVNPLGVQADAVFSEVDGIEDWSWDVIWDSAGKIGDEGYVVEIGLPFNQLRFPRAGGEQTWGFELGRSYPRSDRHRILANRRDRDRSCILCQIGKVTGFESIEPGRNLELTPTLTVNRTDTRPDFPEGPLVEGEEKSEPGLTLRWGVTPSATLSATLNPDFSQVEADVAQLDVNERFALFFPEQRPFFLEGVDYFATPLQAVFTRTVADPNWGLKLTGKEGRNTFGVFVTEDDVNNFLIPSNQRTRFGFIDEEVTGAVLRYRRDIGSNSTLGLLYAGREGDEYHNRVAGLDGFLRFSDRDTVEFQVLTSDTAYPADVAARFSQPRGSIDGHAIELEYEHDGRRWYWDLEYRERDRHFRADSGFVPRVDLRSAESSLVRRIWGDEDDWYNRIVAGVAVERTEDGTGRLTDEEALVFVNFSLAKQSFFELVRERVKIFSRGTLFDGLETTLLYFETQPTGALRFAIFADVGDTVDFVNNREADQLFIDAAVETKVGRHLNVKLDHTLQRLDIDAGEIFEANLTELRLIYNFNVRSFVRAIVQRTDVVRDPALFVDPVEPAVEELFSQLLFSYKLNAQTVLFLGYSDDRLGLDGTSLTQTGRTFFFKVGYAWVL